MSVFTPVSTEALTPWLHRYNAGTCTNLTPIAEGVENTNYFLDTSQGRYVLTLFERLDPAALPFYLGLMHTLAAKGVSAPAPLADSTGKLFSSLCGKPAAIVSRLAGKPTDTPGLAHCAALGDWLARMHLALADFSPAIPNPRGIAWRAETARQVRPLLAADTRELLDRSLQKFDADATFDLPRGVIHADLFRDNALWSNAASQGQSTTLSGVIDFYFACADDWLFDLAVTANDWCLKADGSLDPARCSALLTAYHAHRPLTSVERAAWPTLLGRAALRFWLSRLADLHLPRSGEMVKVKDPEEFRVILDQRHALTEHTAPWDLDAH